MSSATETVSPQTLSRALLFPGPQPPLSHLGATLLRHVVGTVVRYSLYQLGLPMPESPPVRILRLRVFLDAAPLAMALRTELGGPEILAALVLPRGAGELDAQAARVRAAASLHRARLAALGPRRSPAKAEAPAPQQTREQLWAAVCSMVAGRMPYLCDAALGELVTSIARRRLRHAGKDPGLALGLVAHQAHRGGDVDLRALGALDPMAPSWAESGVTREQVFELARRARGVSELPARSGRRGGFREAYRWVLSEVRPLLIELGSRAVEDGIVERSDDVFFLPFDLGVELAAKHRPSWLAAAVAANRREHQGLEPEPEHADQIEGSAVLAPLDDRSRDWDIAPLLPVE